ncbi:MAG: hypothetical protein JWN00_1001 [Actinomycetia bacterium]|nr:hypothetical protein [Actinomycetes bacterium]
MGTVRHRGRFAIARPWSYVIPVLTLGAGTLFAAASSTARGTDLRDSSRTKLTELINAEQQRTAQDRDRYRLLQEQVDRISRQAGRRDTRVETAQGQADRLAGAAGFTPLTGPGLRVVLNDAPRNRRFPDDPAPDDLVVHQGDIQAVVNALWSGGATGLQIMDQRLISTSAVRCVGNTLILQGVVYSPPYRITAVGDAVRLRAALDASPDLIDYKDAVAQYGLGYAVKTLDRVTLPAYTGNVTLNFAQVPSGANTNP